MTDWENQLKKRARTSSRAQLALRQDVAAARLDGMSFRDIGKAAGINHETARTIAIDINGHSHTRDELPAADPAP